MRRQVKSRLLHSRSPTLIRSLAFFFLLACAAQSIAGHLLVLNSADDSVSLVDPVARKAVGRVLVGRGPHHMMAMPDDSALLVGLTAVNQLAFLDRKTGEVTRRIAMADPYQLGFSPGNRYFVVTALRMDYVDIYPGDLAGEVKPLARVKTASMPSHLAFAPDGKFVYVTEQGSDSVARIDLEARKVVDRVRIGDAPAGIWATPDGKHLLVGVMGEDHVAVIDRAGFKAAGKIITGRGAHNFLPMGDKTRLLVSNRAAHTISIIDMNSLKVLETFKAPGGPDCMELTRDGKTLWYSARAAKKVIAIDMDTRKITGEVPVGRSPHGLYYFDHAPRE